jgi:uncharacterized protein YndB with AHSA1/START domain
MADVNVTKDLENNTLLIEWETTAPKEKVWRAYAEKEKFEKWWGPEGWETTTTEFDFRPGGRIHYGMKCVDKNQGEWFGQESWGLVVMEEVEAPNRFVGKDHFSDADGTLNLEMPTMTMEVELVAIDNGTRVVSRSVTESPEQLEELIKMGMVEGFKSQLNKLDTLLSKYEHER